jgi:hypothetical protein
MYIRSFEEREERRKTMKEKCSDEQRKSCGDFGIHYRKHVGSMHSSLGCARVAAMSSFCFFIAHNKASE